MKQTLKQGGDNALNLYSTTAGDYLGWAYLPDITSAGSNPGSKLSATEPNSQQLRRL